MSRYSFKPAVEDPANWIWKYIDYAKECTDAPYEFHEAYAFYLLSLATAGMRLFLSPYPKGLRTNLYILIYGTSSLMRKSTAMEIALDIQGRSLTFARLPADFTPGGLEESVAERVGMASGLFIDEFTGLIDKMNHQTFMAGTKAFMLTMFSRDSWEYQRRAKKGQKDMIEIKDAHLCIIGNVTPAVSSRLQLNDIDDGFLARFAVIMPKAKPARRRLFDLQQTDPDKRAAIGNELLEIYKNSQRAASRDKEVTIDPIALRHLDDFQAEIEERQTKVTASGGVMLERVADMANKCSMIVAAGRPNGFDTGTLHVTESDTLQAVDLARKWAEWSLEFADTIQSSPDEQKILRLVNYIGRQGGKCARRDLMRFHKMSARQMDEMQSTLIQRGEITLTEETQNGSNKPTLYWVARRDEDEVTITPLDDTDDNVIKPPEFQN